MLVHEAVGSRPHAKDMTIGCIAVDWFPENSTS